MTDNTNKTQNTEQKTAQPSHKKGVLSVTAALFLLGFIGLIIFAGVMLYQHNVALRTQQNQLAATVNTLKNDMASLQQASEKSQDLAAQQEKLMAEWKQSAAGDLEKWHIAESFYLVKLANDHLQFSHDTVLALLLLQRADDVLKATGHDGFLDIRKSIAEDIAKIKSASPVNITDIYLQLTGLDLALNQLPLPYSPLKQTAIIAPRHYDDMPWWKATWLRTWDALRKVIIVRNTTQSTLPLVLPDEKPFLYQNMHAQMENVLWALLTRNESIYQQGLARLTNWINTYFDKDAAETKTALQRLSELQQVTIESPAMNVSATVELFDRYMTSKEQASSV